MLDSSRCGRIATLAAAALLVSVYSPGEAADHADAPAVQIDRAADVTDFISFVTEEGSLVSVLTFAPLINPGGAPVYDDEVLYTVHSDRDGDNEADDHIWVRFGQNNHGDWGVQATLQTLGLPVDVVLEGDVETVIESELGVKLWAGLRDDPFFFDLQGLNDTLATSTLSFDSTRDGLAGTNVMAIVVETPGTPGDTWRSWATTGRQVSR